VIERYRVSGTRRARAWGALTTSSSRGADGVECFDRGRARLAAWLLIRQPD